MFQTLHDNYKSYMICLRSGVLCKSDEIEKIINKKTLLQSQFQIKIA